MSDGKFTIEMTLQQADVVSKILQIVSATNKVDPALAGAASSAAKTEKELQKIADTIKKVNATPLEKMGVGIRNAKAAMDAGKISA